MDSFEQLENWFANSQMLQYEIKNGKCEFMTFGDLPYISYEPQGIDMSGYKYAALKFNCDAQGYRFRLAIETDKSTYEYEHELDGSSEWKDYILGLSADGQVKKIYIYFLSDDYSTSNIRISFDRIGFFETKEQAEYFLGRTLISVKEPELHFSPADIAPPQWLFSESSGIAEWQVTGEAFNEIGMLRLQAVNGVSMLTNLKIPFQAEQFKYFSLRYKTSSSQDVAYAVFNQNPDSKSFFVVQNDGDWHNLIIDMSKYTHRLWRGDIENFELHFLNNVSGDEICIERIGFFENYNDASGFLQQGTGSEAAGNTVLVGKNYKITVINQTGYAPENVVAKNISDARGSNSHVVMLNGVPVVLSDISPRGYVVYHAASAGEYAISENKREYDDTGSHWAKDYIDYTSARMLFSGTSEHEFSPDIYITSGMFITVLGRMHGVDTALIGSDSGYSDVNADEYYAPYIKWSRENGIYAPEGDCFYPEQPISRAQMALAISNYTNMCGYEFSRLEPDVQFTDISDCSPEQREAIVNIQSLGVINGKSPDTFDPSGFSTRAEAATVMTRLIKLILGVYSYAPDTSKFVRQDQINIGAFANFDLDILNQNLLNAYRIAGFNTVLLGEEINASPKRNFVFDYCDRYGINVILSHTSSEDYYYDSLEYYSHPSFCGSLLCNEPGSEDFKQLFDRLRKYGQQMDGKKAFVNLLPFYSSADQLKYGTMASYPGYYDGDAELYKSYCSQYASQAVSDIFLFNIFPFSSNGIYKDYIRAVQIASGTAREYGKQLWCMVQSDMTLTDHSMFTRQYYTLLSFGCRNFILWPWQEGLCDANSGLTSTYYAAKSANQQLNAISDVIAKYDYVSTVLYDKNAQIEDLNYTLSELGDAVSDQPFLVGLFKAKDGEGIAFTFLNTSESQTAQIRFNPTCNGIVTYFDGIANQQDVGEDGFFTLSLAPGQGVFVTTIQ